MLCLQKFSKSVLPPKTLSKYALTPHSVSLCVSQPLSHHFRELTQITKSHARLFCHAYFLALAVVAWQASGLIAKLLTKVCFGRREGL